MPRKQRSLLTLGIDEAGRGPAIGPMVLAAVALEPPAARALTRAGLRDSKAFGPPREAQERRDELAALIHERATFAMVIDVESSDVDARVAVGELNLLEREVAERLIRAAPPCTRIIADGKRLFAPLCARIDGMVAYDGGESRHAAVAAASVLAKVQRDARWDEIRRRYEPTFGPISGGGYVNDGTRALLRAYAHRHGTLLPEARRSWPHPYLTDILSAPIERPSPRQLSIF